MPVQPRALLFDLGGVLIDIDFRRALAAWAPYSRLDTDALHRAFAFDAHYQRLERGELDADAFFAHLKARLGLDAPPETIVAGWNAIFVREIVETRARVEAVRHAIPCHAFTNTNPTHTQKWSALYPAVVSAFDRVFMSHEIGRRKPERAAFDHVCGELGLSPGDVLFFDDLAENVQGAAAAGLQAVLVRSPADVATALDALGLPPATR